MTALKVFVFRGSGVEVGLYEGNGEFEVMLGHHAVGEDSYARYSTDDYDTAVEIYDEIRNYVSKHECYECAAETFRIENAKFYRDVEYQVLVECGKPLEH